MSFVRFLAREARNRTRTLFLPAFTYAMLMLPENPTTVTSLLAIIINPPGLG